jgi:rSAM/selenodomain-associated transferase 2
MRISVVVPTLQEADTIGSAIVAARAVLGDCDVIVADGGSEDGTPAAARAAGARVIESAGSRAEAMNAGAALAECEALLFLHADTLLPTGAGDAIRDALATADGGAFRLGFDARPRVWWHLSTRYTRVVDIAYGDQALFVSRAAFERVGGYRPLPIMEDYDLVKRLRRAGPFAIVPLQVRSSARRHRSRGELRTFLLVAAIKLLYRLGVPAHVLARAYRPAR